MYHYYIIDILSKSEVITKWSEQFMDCNEQQH